MVYSCFMLLISDSEFRVPNFFDEVFYLFIAFVTCCFYNQ
jgi:hypothetical protein